MTKQVRNIVIVSKWNTRNFLKYYKITKTFDEKSLYTFGKGQSSAKKKKKIEETDFEYFYIIDILTIYHI